MKKILVLLSAAAMLLTACSDRTAFQAASNPPAAAGSMAVPSQSVRQSGEAALTAGSQAETSLRPKQGESNDWRFDAPENHNMDPAVLEALHAALPGSGIHSMVTVKDGVIIDEYYEDGYDETSLFEIHSASKSYTSALIGIAIDEGYIGGVDDLLSDYLPQAAELTDGKQNLTLRHLLTQTSGIEWYEWGGGASNWSEFRSAENWVDYILRPPQPNICVHDGDGVRPSDGAPFGAECRGMWVFTASAKADRPPFVVDGQVQKIIDPAQVYSGMWANVNIDFFAYNSAGKKGVGCGLNGVQKLRDDEPLVEHVTAERAFSVIPGGNTSSQHTGWTPNADLPW